MCGIPFLLSMSGLISCVCGVLQCRATSSIYPFWLSRKLTKPEMDLGLRWEPWKAGRYEGVFACSIHSQACGNDVQHIHKWWKKASIWTVWKQSCQWGRIIISPQLCRVRRDNIKEYKLYPHYGLVATLMFSIGFVARSLHRCLFVMEKHELLSNQSNQPLDEVTLLCAILSYKCVLTVLSQCVNLTPT